MEKFSSWLDRNLGEKPDLGSRVYRCLPGTREGGGISPRKYSREKRSRVIFLKSHGIVSSASPATCLLSAWERAECG